MVLRSFDKTATVICILTACFNTITKYLSILNSQNLKLLKSEDI